LSTAVSLRSNEGTQVARHEDMPHTEDATMYLTQVHEEVHPAVVKVRERFHHHETVLHHETPVAVERWLTRELFSKLSGEYVSCMTGGMSTTKVAKDMADAKFHAEELRGIIANDSTATR